MSVNIVIWKRVRFKLLGRRQSFRQAKIDADWNTIRVVLWSHDRTTLSSESRSELGSTRAKFEKEILERRQLREIHPQKGKAKKLLQKNLFTFR